MAATRPSRCGGSYCVGRNYAAHARKWASIPSASRRSSSASRPTRWSRSPPAAPGAGLPEPDRQLPLRDRTGGGDRQGRLRHPLEQAEEHVWGYAVGLDMTRRDLQMRMREMGRPWEIGKAFDRSAPIGPLYPASQVGHPRHAAISLQVDGRGSPAQRHRPVDLVGGGKPSATCRASSSCAPGDLVFTGTWKASARSRARRADARRHRRPRRTQRPRGSTTTPRTARAHPALHPGCRRGDGRGTLMPTPDKNNKIDVQASSMRRRFPPSSCECCRCASWIVAMDGSRHRRHRLHRPGPGPEQLSPAQLSPILGAALAGLALGAFAAGPLADRFRT